MNMATVHHPGPGVCVIDVLISFRIQMMDGWVGGCQLCSVWEYNGTDSQGSQCKTHRWNIVLMIQRTEWQADSDLLQIQIYYDNMT